jgi:hypothetical protein
VPATEKSNGGFDHNRINFQERRLMMDLVFVLVIIGFFAACVAYAHAFDRI